MGFYDLSKEERIKLVNSMEEKIIHEVNNDIIESILNYMSDEDTYVRKNTYQIFSRFYRDKEELKENILILLKNLFKNKNELVRQTVINAFGEIGKSDFKVAIDMLETALSDENSKVRNAVIGSLKKMGEKNPKPTLEFAKKYLLHEDPKIRREVIHGIELRGRTHPEDVLPLLEQVQNEQNKTVRKMIIHVLAQISYKNGCLEKVITALNNWKNKELVKDAINEILEVYKRYEKFSVKTHSEAQEYIDNNLKV